MQNGIDYFENKKYNHALLEFNRVLKIEPHNQEAISRIKQCMEELNRE